nr:MAG TPA: hypothetical protein [Caudoviricetes sp.]
MMDRRFPGGKVSFSFYDRVPGSYCDATCMNRFLMTWSSHGFSHDSYGSMPGACKNRLYQIRVVLPARVLLME